MTCSAQSTRLPTVEGAQPHSETVFSPLVAGVCLTALCVAFVSSLSPANSTHLGGLAAGAALLSYLIWLGRRASPRLTLTLYSLYVVVLVVWASGISSVQSSDFGVYFRCGADNWRNASSFRDWARLCQSAWLPGYPTYWRRSLLYTLPLGAISSGSYLALKLYNAALHALAIAVLYRSVRASVGTGAAFAAAAALALYPEYWFTTSLATSDNIVILLLVVWLHLLGRCQQTNTRVSEIAATAAFAVALDFLRDIGLICVLATALAALLAVGRVRLRLLTLAVVSLGATIAASIVASHLLHAAAPPTSLLARVVGDGITSLHTWVDAYRWNQYVYPLVPAHERARYSFQLLALDIQHGVVAAVRNWIAKINILFQGNGYFLFSGSSSEGNPDSLRVATVASWFAFPPAVALVLPGIAAAYAFLAFLGTVKSPASAIGKASIAYSCAFLLLVIGFGEVQSRYAALLGPALAILVASVTTTRPRRLVAKARRTVLAMAAFSIAACGGFFLIANAAQHYLSINPVLTFQGQERKQGTAATACNNERAVVDVTDWYVRMSLPADRPACYSFLFSVAGPTGHKFRYYLARDPVMPRWQTPAASPVSIGLTELDRPTTEATANLDLGKGVVVPSGDTNSITGIGLMRLTVKVAGGLGAPQTLLFGFSHDDAGNLVKLMPVGP